jgi:hypothetical protein
MGKIERHGHISQSVPKSDQDIKERSLLEGSESINLLSQYLLGKTTKNEKKTSSMNEKTVTQKKPNSPNLSISKTRKLWSKFAKWGS